MNEDFRQQIIKKMCKYACQNVSGFKINYTHANTKYKSGNNIAVTMKHTEKY